MTDAQSPNPASTRAKEPSSTKKTQKNSPATLSEEIERIQALLRRMDLQMNDQEIPLKDLAQAVRTAGEGGRSIAQLRRLARQMDSGVLDEEAEQLRAQLFDLLEKLGRRRQEHEECISK